MWRVSARNKKASPKRLARATRRTQNHPLADGADAKIHHHSCEMGFARDQPLPIPIHLGFALVKKGL